MNKEMRIIIRNEIFSFFLNKNIIIITKLKDGSESLRYYIRKDINRILNEKENEYFLNLYKQYLAEFRTEDEELYCIIHKDDISNHICPICKKNFCIFNIEANRYRKTCSTNCSQNDI